MIIMEEFKKEPKNKFNLRYLKKIFTQFFYEKIYKV